jgi:hypothetical protein
LLSKNFKIIKKGTVGHDVMSGGRFGWIWLTFWTFIIQRFWDFHVNLFLNNICLLKEEKTPIVMSTNSFPRESVSLVRELLFLEYHSFTRRVPLIMGSCFFLVSDDNIKFFDELDCSQKVSICHVCPPVYSRCPDAPARSAGTGLPTKRLVVAQPLHEGNLKDHQ